MEAVGLPAKVSKTVYASPDGVELIGVEVHGRDLTVGIHPSKLRELVLRTEAYLSSGKCSGHDMQKLVGHWTWACMPRRCTFSVFNAVYRYSDAAGRSVFDIDRWPSVCRELVTITGLVPLLFSSMKSDWFPKAVATDASKHGQGVTSTPATVEELHLMSLAKPPISEDDEPLDRSLHPTLVGKKWTTIVAAEFRFDEPINILECRAVETAITWVLSFPSSIGVRLLLWCDNTVVVFAARKGRSSKFALLRRLRRLAAMMLATGLQLHINWIPTEVNPSDRPSRKYDPGYDYVPDDCFDSTLGYEGEGPSRRRFLTRAAHEASTRKKYLEAVSMFAD